MAVFSLVDKILTSIVENPCWRYRIQNPKPKNLLIINYNFLAASNRSGSYYWVCTLWWKLFPLLKSFHQRKFLSTISFHLLNCVNSYWFILFRIYPYVNKQLNVNKQLKEIFFDENFSHFLSLWWKLFPLLKSFHQRKFLSTIFFHICSISN